MLDFEPTDPYPDRVESLTAAGFCLWDVLYDCERRGSLDSNIERESEQANDLECLFAAHPGLRLLAFNGGAAQAIFIRHFADSRSGLTALRMVRLPSSSPAHARIDKYEKLAKWRLLLSNE